MDFGILGPLEVRAGGQVVALGGVKPRAVLAVLALNANRAVSAERLAVALWGEDAPPGAVKTVQVHVARLRKALGNPDVLVTTPAGYCLRVGPGELDAERFEHGVAAGREALAAGRGEAAAAALREALELWRGPPLAEFVSAPFAPGEIARLEEQRLAALELRVEADLATGRHAELVGELTLLGREHPWRERLAAQLMLALYRCGRHPEALHVFRQTRAQLADGLGLEPSEELRRLERQILNQDAELDAEPHEPTPAPAPGARTNGERRLASIVSVELDGTPAGGDPEAVHALVLGCWRQCADAIEAHGGVVEHYGNTTLVGSFGVAAVHEDDALRALRAALTLPALDQVPLRVGVDTGTVFVGDGGDGTSLAIGEAVGNAARLARMAGANEVLFGSETWALVRDAVRAEPSGAHYRLLGLGDDQAVPEPPFVGREHERQVLLAALAPGEPCRLVTVVGAAGVGKSRLAREVLAGIGARVLVGRCRAYGEGVTYGPLTEIVQQLGEPQIEPAVLDATRTADTPRSSEETALAFRRLFERLAADGPLVLVFEDIHWAAPTLLDLLEYMAAFSTGFPIVLLCLARPELREARPDWPVALSLEPLGPGDARTLAERLGAGAEAERIVARADGNPLFLQHLAAIGTSGSLPSSIRAVLAARIAQLAATEREMLLQASVEGRTFHAGALAGEEQATALVQLVRKQLIRADPISLAGEDAFRFTHALVREAAYAELSKRRRAQSHEQLARWLAGHADALDEIVGHHLEQACLYNAELGVECGFEAEAAQRLEAGGQAALTRGDMPAGIQLLERAAALAPEPRRLAALGAALVEGGRLDDAERVLSGTDDEVELAFLRLHLGGSCAQARAVAEHAITTRSDAHGLCRAWRLRAWVAWTESRAAEADDAWSQALDLTPHARERVQILGWRASAAAFGPLPVPQAIARCREIRGELRDTVVAHAVAARPLALLYALGGDTATAFRLIDESAAALDELDRMHSAVSHHAAIVHMLADDPAAAERHLRAGMTRLQRMHERAISATTVACLAQAVLALGRDAEAAELCETAAADADPDDAITHIIWRGTLARVLARRGRLAQAEALAREAVEIAARTDALVDHGDALLVLAEILALDNRPDAAQAAARHALALYERKGAAVLARRARAFPTHQEVSCPVPSSTQSS